MYLNAMRKIVFIIYMIHSSYVFAQNFSPMGVGFWPECRTIYADSTSGLVYVGGPFQQLGNGDTMLSVAVWNGTTWNAIASGLHSGGICLSILKYNSHIFFGGGFIQAGGNPYIGLATWDGNSWGSVGDVISFSGVGGVRRLIVHDSELYLVGYLGSAGGIPIDKIARWDGTSWHSYPDLHPSGYNLMAAAIYNSELYVGGQFYASSQMNDIAKFDGTNWVPVLNGLSGVGWVGDMKVYKNELYVAGSFQSINGDPGNGIIRWNGTSWDDLGGGTDAVVYDMAIVNDELYIVGFFNQVSGVPASKIAKWDGNQWYGLGSNINSAIYSISAMNNEIYIAGHFTQIDGVTMNRVAKYTIPSGLSESQYFYDEIKVYPTLTSGLITVDVKSGELQNVILYDIADKKILHGNHSDNKCIIDIGCQLPGIYILMVQTSLGTAYRKVILKSEN